MSFLPLNFVVQRVRRVKVLEKDELNNDVWEESESRDSVKVAGWSKPASDEPKLAGHGRVTVDIELFAPVGVFQVRDAVQLPGRDGLLEVVGEPENYSHSPFGWDPGLEVVNLAGVAP